MGCGSLGLCLNRLSSTCSLSTEAPRWMSMEILRLAMRVTGGGLNKNGWMRVCNAAL